LTPWTERNGTFSPLKAATLALLCVPVLMLAYRAIAPAGGAGNVGLLGPRPITEAIHETGDWAIRFLILSLAVTPLRRILQWPKLILVRRMIGLSALFYALLHFALYCADMKWDLARVSSEIVLRVYLTIGFATLLGLAVLGSTSTDAAIRRLGKNWNRLHTIVYALAILAALHFFMQTKADVYEATLMAGIFGLLMLYRAAHRFGYQLTSPVVLVCAAIAAAVLCAAVEYAWYAIATGIPPLRVLEANLYPLRAIRPAWWVLAIGLGVALAAPVRGIWAPVKTGRPARA